MEKITYLIDANSLITPNNSFYPFEWAPGFWEQIEKAIVEGNIAILDMVKAEILQGKDKLKEWMEQLDIGNYIDHRDSDILKKYGEILEYVHDAKCYKEAAVYEWSKEEVADPWLIATASCKNCVLVTLEKSGNPNPIQPAREAKIPDVASVFGVKTIDLFKMMQELKFRLN